MSVKIRSFAIEVPVDEVHRMKRKLRDTRIPQKPIVPEAGDDYGHTVLPCLALLLTTSQDHQ
jgi:hypothetical protein